MIRRPPRSTLFPTRRSSDLATVGADGTPHVVPVSYIYNAVRDTIDVGGHELERTKKFRDVALTRSEEHTSELQSRRDLVCRLLLEKKNTRRYRDSRQQFSSR